MRSGEKHNYILLNLSSSQNANRLPRVEDDSGAMALYGSHMIRFDNILPTGRSFVVALKTGKGGHYVALLALSSPTNSVSTAGKIFHVQDTVTVSV